MSNDRRPDPWERVEAIFTRLAAQFGAKLTDQWGGLPLNLVKAEWCDALATYHSSEITRGLQGCQTRAVPPNIGTFLHLCRPALDPETAWIEAQAGMKQRAAGEAGEWTHPAVFRAAREFGLELRSGTFAQHRKQWKWLLEKEFQKGWGEDVQKPTTAIGNEQKKRVAGPDELMRMAALKREITLGIGKRQRGVASG